MDTLNVGIIGCGNISGIYLQNIPAYRGLSLKACADARPEAAQAQASRAGIEALSVDELLARTPGHRRPKPGVAAALPAPTVPTAAPSPPVPSIAAAPPPVLAAPPAPEMPAVPPFTRELRLVSIDASRNRARFYVLQWQPTLWGSVMLVRLWGRLGGQGRQQVVLEAATAQVDAPVTRLIRLRLRHGYHIVDWH